MCVFVRRHVRVVRRRVRVCMEPYACLDILKYINLTNA